MTTISYSFESFDAPCLENPREELHEPESITFLLLIVWVYLQHTHIYFAIKLTV